MIDDNDFAGPDELTNPCIYVTLDEAAAKLRAHTSRATTKDLRPIGSSSPTQQLPIVGGR